MKRTTFGLLSVALAALFLWNCGGGPATIAGFDKAAFNKNMSQVAAQYLSFNNPKDVKNSIINKVAIVEFNVEFLVDLNKTTTYKQLVDEMYDVFVKEMSATTGWEFVSKDAVINSPIYQSMTTQEVVKGGGYSKKGGYAYTTTTAIYPPTGMGILSMEKAKGLKALAGAFKSLGNVQKEAGVLEDVGADAGLKVHLIAYVHDDKKVKKDARACIPAGVEGLASISKMDINIGCQKSPGGLVGIEGPDGVKYIYGYKGVSSVTFASYKKAPGRVISTINCKPAKGKGILIKEYCDGRKEVCGVFAKMAGTLIKDAK